MGQRRVAAGFRHGAAAADVQRREALLVAAVQICAGLCEERHDRELVADSSMVRSGPSLARHTGAPTRSQQRVSPPAGKRTRAAFSQRAKQLMQ